MTDDISVRMDNIKIHRRCNEIELARIKQSFLQAMKVLEELNGKESVQLTTVRIDADPLPNAVGCSIDVKMFVYAPKDEAWSK